jgi:hypothetical protein
MKDERKNCVGYDDPEDRCPRRAEECICWQGRTEGYEETQSAFSVVKYYFFTRKD